MSEDIKPEVIKRTQETLGRFVKKPQLMEKFLKKPPFRFLHDVVTAVIRDTCFLKGLFSPDEMNCETIKNRESKVAFLQKLIDAVKAITGEPLTARPSKIVAGQEPTKTNELLQAIGKALMNKLSSTEVVEEMKSGKAGKPLVNKNKSTTPGKVAPQAQPRERAKNKDVDKSDKKKMVPSKVHGSESKSSLRKEDKKEPKGNKEKKPKSVSVSKTNGIATKDEGVIIKQSEAVGPMESVNVPASAVVVAIKSSELHGESQVENLEAVSSDKVECEEIASKGIIMDNEKPEQTAVSAEKNVMEDAKVDEPLSSEPIEMVRRPPSALGGRKPSAKVIVSMRGSGDAVPKELEQSVANRQSDPEFSSKQNNESLPEQAKPLLADELKTKKSPPLQRPMSVVRPASTRRSARPASARPAAPRIRDRGEAAVVEETPSVVGKVNVIPEGDASMELEEDENFVVLETQAPMLVEERPQTLAPEPQERGHLVAQILETQKELEDRGHVGSANHESGKVEIEWEMGQRREREAVNKEVERLRCSIQTLARAAYPLGKLMDFLHEDVDAMQRELGRWHMRKSELMQELRQEQALTERSVQPLRLRLQSLQDAIDEQRDQISAVKATILHNDEHISKLLMGLTSPV